MHDRTLTLAHVAVLGAAGLLAVPFLGELVARPAFSLGWSFAARCAAFVSNGFAA